MPVGEEALALLVCVKLVAGMGDACEGEHGRGSKPAEFGEGNGAEGVATRRSCGSVAGVKATGKLAVKLVGAVDKAGRSGVACASGSDGGSARTHRGVTLAVVGLDTAVPVAFGQIGGSAAPDEAALVGGGMAHSAVAVHVIAGYYAITTGAEVGGHRYLWAPLIGPPPVRLYAAGLGATADGSVRKHVALLCTVFCILL